MKVKRFLSLVAVVSFLVVAIDISIQDSLAVTSEAAYLDGLMGAEYVVSEPLNPIPEPTYAIDEDDIIILAKLMYGECRGIPDSDRKAAVCWVALNRVDATGYGNNLYDVVVSSGHFTGYKDSNPVWDNLYWLAKDVLYHYYAEKDGYSGCRRVIPKDYLWFYGNGRENVFRNSYKGGAVWDWSYEKFYD